MEDPWVRHISKHFVPQELVKEWWSVMMVIFGQPNRKSLAIVKLSLLLLCSRGGNP